jgi:predicted nucleic acid-binding protein
MRIFLDTSVLLAASASSSGASRYVFDRARRNSWMLLATPHVVEEVLQNLNDLPPAVFEGWTAIRLQLFLMDDVPILDGQVIISDPAKDRPVLFGALAWASILLTLDQHDFASLLGKTIFGLQILEPSVFLQQERNAGRLR